MSSNPRIAIVGAGVAGLTLARVLQVHGIRSTVFDLDASATSRDQGGTLDLHVESGQSALHAAGLYERFQKFVRADGQEMRFVDKHGKVHVQDVSTDNIVERPEIDRGTLRRILVESVDQGILRWGAHVKRIQQIEPGKYTVVVGDQQEQGEPFDLVVGADGAWSKVRPLLSKAQPVYTGAVLIECRFLQVDQHHPNVAELVGGGSCFIMADRKCIMAQRNGDGSIRVYVCFHVDEDALPAMHTKLGNPSVARSYILELLNDWDDNVKDLIRLCDDNFILRPMYAMPVPHVWESQPGLTLIGDAAHLMSPFAGEGANMAMWDGSELAKAIVGAVQSGKPLAEAISSFEQQMLTMVRPMTELSATNLKQFLAPNGLEEAVQFWNALKTHEQ
ncbi:hypothetical protein BGZ73_007385 [Actinomortierella ambigua]|nr:hypothetical protein BGZ73_007385 [Actinomortierella ambigua]